MEPLFGDRSPRPSVGGPWWDAGMQAADDLAAAAAALRSVAPRFHSSTDDELIVDVQQIEALGRMVDGWDGEPSSLWRKRIARHLRECPVCTSRSRELLGAARLLAAGDVAGEFMASSRCWY